MHAGLLVPLLALGLGACAGGDDDDDDDVQVDTDGDGLDDDDEESRGTDPNNTDSDGDTLLDGDEVDMGTDPLSTDTDGDTYLDPWEIAEGTDPTDAESRIYVGYWPYQPDKDSLEDPGWDDRARSGNSVPRFVAQDQFGEQLDLYDYSLHGKPIVMDLSGKWCGYCKEMAKWLEGDESSWYFSVAEDYDWEEWVERVPELIENGDIYWVTVIDSGSGGYNDSPTEDDITGWAEDYPNEHIALMLDEDQAFQGWIDPSGWPTVFLVEEDMTIGKLSRMDYTAVFEELVERYPE